MSAEQVPAEGASIIRLSDHRPIAEPTDDAIQLGREQHGAVEKVADATPRPTVRERAADAGRLMWLGLTDTAQTVHHYEQAGEWIDRIEIAKRQLALAKDDDERDKINDRIGALRAERKMIRRERHREGGTIAGAIGAVAYPAGIVIGTLAVGPLVLTGVLPIPIALWFAGRKARKQQELVLEQAAPREGVELMASSSQQPEQTTDGQVRGSADLIAALVKATVIIAAERGETQVVGTIREDGPGWAATVDLPGGKEATEAVAKIGKIASALRVKAQRIELRADTSEGAHEGRFTMWVANEDDPWDRPRTPSLLIDAERWNFWRDGVPLGADARLRRQILHLLWRSKMIGGLQDYGKSYLARLIASAAALDPRVKIILICGKPGPDWAPLKDVAHSYVVGATPDRLAEVQEVMEDTIADMQGRGDRLESLYEQDPDRCPEGKLTEELAGQRGMEMTLVIVDELQELLDAAAMTQVRTGDDEDGGRGRSGKTVLVETFARFSRVSRYVGGMGLYITQRPDADSVPTKLREVCAKRASTRVKGVGSAKMVLGDDAVAAGAAPHLLLEHHKGVFVIDSGAAEGHVTVYADTIDLPAFKKICMRGRQLRLDAGTLTGYAAKRDETVTAGRTPRRTVRDAIAVMETSGGRMPTEVLTDALRGHDPALYGDLTVESLRALMKEAGVGSPVPIGAWDGQANPRGYKREVLERAL
jgi:hypothetical protein